MVNSVSYPAGSNEFINYPQNNQQQKTVYYNQSYLNAEPDEFVPSHSEEQVPNEELYTESELEDDFVPEENTSDIQGNKYTDEEDEFDDEYISDDEFDETEDIDNYYENEDINDETLETDTEDDILSNETDEDLYPDEYDERITDKDLYQADENYSDNYNSDNKYIPEYPEQDNKLGIIPQSSYNPYKTANPNTSATYNVTPQTSPIDYKVDTNKIQSIPQTPVYNTYPAQPVQTQVQTVQQSKKSGSLGTMAIGAMLFTGLAAAIDFIGWKGKHVKAIFGKASAEAAEEAGTKTHRQKPKPKLGRPRHAHKPTGNKRKTHNPPRHRNNPNFTRMGNCGKRLHDFCRQCINGIENLGIGIAEFFRKLFGH